MARKRKLSGLVCSKDERKRIKEALEDPDKLSAQDAFKILKACSSKKAKREGK